MLRQIFLVCLILALASARDYKSYSSIDCYGNDIKQVSERDPKELMKICDGIEGCIGFNSNGWLKNNCPSYQIVPGLTTYLIDSIFIPTGEEPDVLLWPMPANYKSGDREVAIDPLNIRFTVNYPSEELRQAITRFKDTIFRRKFVDTPSGAINEVRIELKEPTSKFVISKDESYTLVVPDDGSAIEITAANLYGAYHALNSLMFLIQFNYDKNAYIIKHAPYAIEDKPFLHYRALMIDSSRHFLPLRSIKRIIDAMSWVKFNVLHWHLVDDQAFPVQIPSVPEMWKGSFTPEERYTKWDIQEIVEYARLRGVHVLAEMDVPGHAKSWCVGQPEMCPSEECNTPLDPSREVTFETIDKMLNDLIGAANDGMFPGELFHIGGDEVDTSCWDKVDHVVEWMKARNFTAKDAYGYFVNRMDAMVRSRNRETIAWEEVYVNHKDIISKDMIIHMWLADESRLKKVVADGFRAIVSNYRHWYLPQLWETWDIYYGFNFLDGIPKEQWDLIYGGEVCMWGETVDASDFENTIMPRAIAAAERMWTHPDLLDIDKASERLPYIRCEFNRRGVQASPTFGQGRSAPVGPGSCMVQFFVC